MAIPVPTADQVNAIAQTYGLSISENESSAIIKLSKELAEVYARIESLSRPIPDLNLRRSPGCAPDETKNQCNAWAWECEITGASDGPLRGSRVAVKDNICVAGIPMQNGSRLLEGFVPETDATVVTRVLDAGGIIAGKTVCESLCLSGGSHTSFPLPVLNPHDPERSAGGSSSGNAAAIACGDVSMAIGGDQGGSIRTPASWCGIVGLKPTFGLVPYAGAFPMDPSIDHLGPMGATVEDVARLLDAIASPEICQARGINADQAFTKATHSPARGLKIGIVSEGFGRPESSEASDHVVLNSLSNLKAADAKLETISIAWHIDGYHIASAIVADGAVECVFNQNAAGYGFEDGYPVDLTMAWSKAWRSRPNELPEIAKFLLLYRHHTQTMSNGRHYRQAQGLRQHLRNAYDEALERFDVLAMPTTPFCAAKLPDRSDDFATRYSAGLEMEGNTAPFNVSGHPAISMPCGFAEGLPVGLMLIGRHFGEQMLLRAAAAVQEASEPFRSGRRPRGLHKRLAALGPDAG